MGGRSSCGCGSGSDKHQPILYDVPNKDWADAVKKLNVSGIKMLHQDDPDIINLCVSDRGELAIHIAIKRKHLELFQYLLKYGADINALRGSDGNSCLHLAVINRDLRVIQELFSHDVDDSLINKEMKTAADLIEDKTFRRRFMRTKNNHKYQEEHIPMNLASTTLASQRETSRSESIGGMSLSDISMEIGGDHTVGTLEGDGGRDAVTMKFETPFGHQVGCEVKEIAYYLQELGTNQKSSRVWGKWVRKEHITKPHDLVKVIYGLTVLTLRSRKGAKQRQRVKPPSKPMARLASRVYQMFPVVLTSATTLPSDRSIHRKKRRILTKDNFILNFHTFLYRAHDEMVNEQREQERMRRKSLQFV